MLEKLQTITKKTKKELEELKIVTPDVYETVFNINAINNDFPVFNKKDYNKLFTKEIKIIEEHNKLFFSSLDNANYNINNAIECIKNKNSEGLEKINLEMAEIYKKMKEMENEIYKDHLTSIYNRKWFENKFLNNNFAKTNGFLVFVDLNDFKLINDNYGHTIGDKTLQLFTKFIKKFLNKLNIQYYLIRYAGDEFLILFDYTKEYKDINEIMKDLYKDINKKKLKTNNNNNFKITFSYGIESFKISDNFKYVMDIADKKMYKYKANFKMENIKNENKN